jgi:hypothetical protein
MEDPSSGQENAKSQWKAASRSVDRQTVVFGRVSGMQVPADRANEIATPRSAVWSRS